MSLLLKIWIGANVVFMLITFATIVDVELSIKYEIDHPRASGKTPNEAYEYHLHRTDEILWMIELFLVVNIAVVIGNHFYQSHRRLTSNSN